jgi:hypothetical protein
VTALFARDDAVADRRQRAVQKPWRAFSFMARKVCSAFSLDWSLLGNFLLESRLGNLLN